MYSMFSACLPARLMLIYYLRQIGIATRTATPHGLLLLPLPAGISEDVMNLTITTLDKLAHRLDISKRTLRRQQRLPADLQDLAYRYAITALANDLEPRKPGDLPWLAG